MTGYVYFFETGDGLVKIGKANNVETRFKQIKTACPTGLKVLATIETDNPFLLEGNLHERFKKNRLKGEWFDISKSDVSQVMKEVEMGYGLSQLEALQSCIHYFEKIANKMAQAPEQVQDADIFFTHANVKYFDRVIKNAESWDKYGYHSDFITLSKTLAFNLFMLAQANGSGPDKDVNLQQTSRDILGLVRIIGTHIALRDRSSYIDAQEDANKYLENGVIL